MDKLLPKNVNRYVSRSMICECLRAAVGEWTLLPVTSKANSGEQGGGVAEVAQRQFQHDRAPDLIWLQLIA